MKQEPLREFKYHWRYSKTGTIGTRTIKTDNRWEFLEKLAEWNRQSAEFMDGVWLYWEAEVGG